MFRHLSCYVLNLIIGPSEFVILNRQVFFHKFLSYFLLWTLRFYIIILVFITISITEMIFLVMYIR